jgi:hypothetical protein
MEQALLQEFARQADHLVAKRRRQVAAQHQIVAELELAGRDATEARKLLGQFEACLFLQVNDRDRLHNYLGLD